MLTQVEISEPPQLSLRQEAGQSIWIILFVNYICTNDLDNSYVNQSRSSILLKTYTFLYTLFIKSTKLYRCNRDCTVPIGN